MRNVFEDLEEKNLSPLAVKSKQSNGRQYDESVSENRTCFQRDRDRIIHSKAFRRLKHKTQVFLATGSDHVRSRLVHSIEVAQISRHLARLLRCNEDLCEAIALAHDLGHTPFGHAGEAKLNELMKDSGGFEHNIQSLRIVDFLEQKYPQFPGLNLSYEVRMGLAKHTTPWDHPKEASSFVSLEAQIANLADEIAYNNHDIDDGLSTGILEEGDLETQVVLWREAKDAVKNNYANLSEKELCHLINSRLISSQVKDVVVSSKERLSDSGVKSLEELQKITVPIIGFSDEMQEKSKALRQYLFDRFYTHHSVYRMNKKGQRIIGALFEAFNSDIKLLPRDYREKIGDDYTQERVIADYIAGMTDNYAHDQHETMFS